MGRRPARPIICQHFTAQPGRARSGPAHDTGREANETRALYGPARHSCGPAHLLSSTNKMCLLMGGVIYVVSLIVSSGFLEPVASDP